MIYKKIKKVLIKIYDKEKILKLNGFETIKAEINILRKIKHYNIIQIYDV